MEDNSVPIEDSVRGTDVDAASAEEIECQRQSFAYTKRRCIRAQQRPKLNPSQVCTNCTKIGKIGKIFAKNVQSGRFLHGQNLHIQTRVDEF
jgi:hypothetical protein